MPSWIQDARDALSGKPNARTEVLPTHAPSLLTAATARALLAPLLAMFMWAVAYLQTKVHTSLHPLALLPRALAYAMTLRSLWLAGSLSGPFQLWRTYRQFGLALTDSGFYLRTPERDVSVAREHILDVRAQSSSARTRSAPKTSTVYVVTHPDSGAVYVPLPAIFGHPHGLVARLLQRPGRGAPNALHALQDTGSAAPEQLWERAAHDPASRAAIAIRRGLGWLWRGPYTSTVLALTVLDSYWQLPAQTRKLVDPTPALAFAALLLCVPVLWIGLGWVRLRARHGLSFVLTADALLTHAGTGVLRVPWSSVTSVEVQTHAAWSLFLGAHEMRTLVIHSQAAGDVRCPEDFLDLPVEVVAALCDFCHKLRPSMTES